MKRYPHIARFCGLFLLSFCMVAASAQTRKETYLADGWRFSHTDSPECAQPQFDDSAWERVRVPHDWAIAGPFDRHIDMQTVAIVQNGEKVASEKTGRTGSLPWIGTGWYRTQFSVSKDYPRTLLQFDGAMSEPVVYVNGREAGHWAYGYNTFYIDITPYIIYGQKNTLAVRLQNRPESSRWYPGAGLYRPVRLIQTQPAAIAPWGITVTTPHVSEQESTVEITAAFTKAMAGKWGKMETKILDDTGTPFFEETSLISPTDTLGRQTAVLADAALWSPENPVLYTAVVSLYTDDKKVDEVRTKFGIRSVKVSADGGFQLNGQTRKIKGVCLHHDLGPLGAAINKAALTRQLLILKKMGCDAIRTAHNMPSPWQMDLCDSLGMMVMAESFDMWRYPKCKNGYAIFFDEWADRDIENLVRCHRNHPSIVMWSIGNEIPEQGNAEGVKIATHLQDICHRLDPTRPVTTGMDRVDDAVKSGFAAAMDVPGLNYRCNKYEMAYNRLPQGFILGSETASTVSSRGVYKFPVKEFQNKAYNDGQCSSYDLEACSWSNIPEVDWVLQDDKPWVIGEFVWTGFDYLGEPTPYDGYGPSRSSYFGICDLAGLPKDRYYLYRSRWNTEKNTLHLLPHWTWPGREGEITPVYCYTNSPSAELFVNGISQGRRTKDKAVQNNRYRLHWDDVKYQPGTLKVVAYDEDGRAVGTEEIRTAGAPHHLSLEADKKTLKADGEDLIFITVRVLDKNGNLCPTADNALKFSVSGAGSFKAACNGDATSQESFAKPTMQLFNGQLVFIAQSGTKAGKLRVRVSGKGLKTVEKTFETID